MDDIAKRLNKHKGTRKEMSFYFFLTYKKFLNVFNIQVIRHIA